jgi:hypothetical protein
MQLQLWWMEEIKKLTGKVLKQEEKRQETARKKGTKLLGDMDIERREDIDDLYAFGAITDAKRNKLISLWEDMQPEPSELYNLKLKLLQEAYEEAHHIYVDEMEKECDL